DAPQTLVIGAGDLRSAGIAAGDAVIVTPGRLTIAGCLDVALGEARRWQPTLPRYPRDPATLEFNLRAARRVHAAEVHVPAGNAQRVADELVSARTAALVDALARGDQEAAAAAGTAMLGLGRGLTPSGDDVLVGMLAVLHMPGSPRHALAPIGARIAARAHERTHAISAAALHAAAGGRVRASIAALLDALATGTPARAAAALARLLSIGSSSGRDMLTGILAGFDVHRRAFARS
ncbi:MAG TPA: DUF2877 domain-containing protein, partial [Casimicrobiaceae bacterium]|nr:DUF2877 domain-containing protein [Casimicrobiaceae bacterium]